jgi:hypothetical protein
MSNDYGLKDFWARGVGTWVCEGPFCRHEIHDIEIRKGVRLQLLSLCAMKQACRLQEAEGLL